MNMHCACIGRDRLELAVIAFSRRRPSLLLFGSSWPGLVLQARPFSNGLELCGTALIFNVCLTLGWARGTPRHTALQRSRHVRWALVGVLGALGIFVRFTFVVPDWAIMMPCWHQL